VSQSDLDALLSGYEALNRGDISVIRDQLDPEIEWHEGHLGPEAGIHHGRDSFLRFVGNWLEAFDDFHLEPKRVIEAGDCLIAVLAQTGRGRASGAPVEAEVTHCWTVVDGRAIAWRSYGNLAKALEDAGDDA
jgi:ketosteroid isomerase-like protein